MDVQHSQRRLKRQANIGAQQTGYNYAYSPQMASNVGSFNNGLYGSFGHHGHGCCKKDDKTYELLAIGIALFALAQALMMRRRRKKRSADSDLEETDSVWARFDRGKMQF